MQRSKVSLIDKGTLYPIDVWLGGFRTGRAGSQWRYRQVIYGIPGFIDYFTELGMVPISC